MIELQRRGYRFYFSQRRGDIKTRSGITRKKGEKQGTYWRALYQPRKNLASHGKDSTPRG